MVEKCNKYCRQPILLEENVISVLKIIDTAFFLTFSSLNRETNPQNDENDFNFTVPMHKDIFYQLAYNFK